MLPDMQWNTNSAPPPPQNCGGKIKPSCLGQWDVLDICTSMTLFINAINVRSHGELVWTKHLSVFVREARHSLTGGNVVRKLQAVTSDRSQPKVVIRLDWLGYRSAKHLQLLINVVLHRPWGDLHPDCCKPSQTADSTSSMPPLHEKRCTRSTFIQRHHRINCVSSRISW